jgi:hypothetical protein
MIGTHLSMEKPTIGCKLTLIHLCQQFGNHLTHSLVTFVCVSEEGFALQEEMKRADFECGPNAESSRLTNQTVDPMHYFRDDGVPILEDGSAEYFLPGRSLLT